MNERVLWGQHPAYGDKPIKLTGGTPSEVEAAYRRRKADGGWTYLAILRDGEAPATAADYVSQSAKDAASSYGQSYCDYLDKAAQEHHDYFMAHGDPVRATEMLTQSLGEALMGNDGE